MQRGGLVRKLRFSSTFFQPRTLPHCNLFLQHSTSWQLLGSWFVILHFSKPEWLWLCYLSSRTWGLWSLSIPDLAERLQINHSRPLWPLPSSHKERGPWVPQFCSLSPGHPIGAAHPVYSLLCGTRTLFSPLLLQFYEAWETLERALKERDELLMEGKGDHYPYDYIILNDQ